jgi:hypothetical protein
MFTSSARSVRRTKHRGVALIGDSRPGERQHEHADLDTGTYNRAKS